jgi:hypothetical protein
MREPQSLASIAGLRTASGDVTDAEGISPTTPKAAQAATPTGAPPEYIHMQWDHNTGIVDDLFRLVEQIDERVQQGKRVLIHCQCGVSRSASLIVAYGLYKNPSLTVQEAYDAVKERSRWIGPNMSLIYQLSEFRTKLVNKTSAPPPGLRHWRNGLGIMGNGRSNTIPTSSPTKRASLSGEAFDAVLARRSEPLTAPLPDARDGHDGPCGESKPSTAGTLNTERPNRMSARHSTGGIPAGPSSAPSGMSWLSDAMASGRSVTSVAPTWGGSTLADKDVQHIPKLPSLEQSPSSVSNTQTSMATAAPTPRPSRFQPSREVTISKALSYILRHGAVKEGITLDAAGYARVSDLVSASTSRSPRSSLSSLTPCHSPPPCSSP